MQSVVNKAQFTIDWLQISFPEDSLQKVKQTIQSVTGEGFSPVKVPPEQAYRKGEQSSECIQIMAPILKYSKYHFVEVGS